MAKQTLYCSQNTDFSTTITLAADDGSAINVAGFVFTGVIRKNWYSINASATLIITSPDAPNGNVQISLDTANTANLEIGQYNYTVQFKNAANSNAILLDGLFIVTPNVILTQPTPSTVPDYDANTDYPNAVPGTA